MASVCGSTLALMDAGVPIKARRWQAWRWVSSPIPPGDAMILTDIQGTEDHLGDMDFKVAGTAKGITALQMDIKITGISAQMMREALEQARTARLSILEKMLEVMPAPRPDTQTPCPAHHHRQDPVDKIGALIRAGRQEHPRFAG